jgi:predicted nucleic acid-binding protein
VIVLDTNVVSELMRKEPEPRVIEWVDGHPASDVFLTSVTTAELLYGIARLPDGRRKDSLAAKTQELLLDDFAGQVLAFTVDASAHYADIVVTRERRGAPISMADGQIAAICRLYGAVLATRNVKDFVGSGVDVRDPWA